MQSVSLKEPCGVWRGSQTRPPWLLANPSLRCSGNGAHWLHRDSPRKLSSLNVGPQVREKGRTENVKGVGQKKQPNCGFQVSKIHRTIVTLFMIVVYLSSPFSFLLSLLFFSVSFSLSFSSLCLFFILLFLFLIILSLFPSLGLFLLSVAKIHRVEPHICMLLCICLSS